MSPTIEVESDFDEGPISEGCMKTDVDICLVKPKSSHCIVLIIFAGPKRPGTSLHDCILAHGLQAEAYDILNGPHQDLAGDAVWRPLFARAREGQFCALVASRPCSSFSRARNRPGGPPPLGGLLGQDRYGLKHLTPKQNEMVRLHNLFAIRTAEIAQWFVASRRPVLIEQPAIRSGEVSMFRLD